MHNKYHQIDCQRGEKKWEIGKIKVKNRRLNKWEKKKDN